MAWPLPCPQRIETSFGKATITYHAMKQFYKRYLETHPNLPQENKDSVDFFHRKFCKHLNTSIELERKNSIWQAIKYDSDARYFRSKKGHGPWLFVVSDNNYVITVMRWQPCKSGMYRRKRFDVK